MNVQGVACREDGLLATAVLMSDSGELASSEAFIMLTVVGTLGMEVFCGGALKSITSSPGTGPRSTWKDPWAARSNEGLEPS